MNNQPHLFEVKPERQIIALNSYLRIAYLALLAARRPLHASDILSVADKLGIMPDHLFGETQVKTLNARLSIEIKEKSTQSLFFRTGPAVYFLRELANNDQLQNEYLEFRGEIRRRPISEEKILVAPRAELEGFVKGDFVDIESVDVDSMLSKTAYFKDRWAAELDTSVKQFVSYTLVRSKSRFLVFQRGKYSNSSENLQDTLSIAFGGHVSEVDFDLFHSGDSAFLNNSSREFLEELDWSGYYKTADDVSLESEVLGFINVDSNSDALQHIAVVVIVDHASPMTPTRGELGISKPTWFETDQLEATRSSFDLWSRILIDRILEGGFE